MRGDISDRGNGTERLDDDEAREYFRLLNKRDFGEDDITQTEAQRLQELEDKEFGVESSGGGFRKMTQGDNSKKNKEVTSLYTQYKLTKEEQRAVHNLITGKHLSRDQIEKVIKNFKGIDCDD